MSLLKNIRFYVLVLSFFNAIAIYYKTVASVSEGLVNLRLLQYYAFTAVVLLYITLMIGPFLYIFKGVPFREQILKARRAIGVSVFFYALLHAYLALFGQLGGFSGLFFLPTNYLIAISLSSAALFILFLMAATSFDKVIAKMSFRKWKKLHRFIYLAAVLVLIHALMLGSDFQDLSTIIPQIFFLMFASVILVEANRFDFYLKTKFPNLPTLGVGMILLLTLIGLIVFGSTYFIKKDSADSTSLNIHGQHQQAITQLQQSNANLISKFSPGGVTPSYLQGDVNKRYTVTLLKPPDVLANKSVDLEFVVYDANNGYQNFLFSTLFEKPTHLVIVNQSLNYFQHIHPVQVGGSFKITTQFPENGLYHLYLNYQPTGAIEQQAAFSIQVGPELTEADLIKNQKEETNTAKTFGNYQVTLVKNEEFQSERFTSGNQIIKFKITDLQGNGVTNLKPYLAAFGHLVLVNESTFDYLHVHPNNLVAPKPADSGGPEVDFIPMGLYGPIKPGIYKAFGEFNPDNNLFVSDFVIDIK